MEWVIVSVLGGLVGVGELVSRYRDAPARALLTVPAVLYISLNIAAAVIALVLVRGFNWTFGVNDPDSDAVNVTQVLVAGFGAMALFRSSLFVVRVGDQDVGVGPSSFLQVVLGAADRAVDRVRAQARATSVAKAMAGVSFDLAYVALPSHCLALMQNLPQEDQEKLGNQIAALRDSDMTDLTKTLNLGLVLMNIAGEGVLVAAVKSLDSNIRQSPTAPGERG